MLRMCVYEAVKSEHRAVPGFQNIIFLRGDSFIQANPVISVPESFVHQLNLFHLVFVPFLKSSETRQLSNTEKQRNEK